MSRLIALAVALVACGPGSPPSSSDLACGPTGRMEGATCAIMDDCCQGLFCVALGPPPFMATFCCHTTAGVPCDAGACCPTPSDGGTP